MSQWATTVQLPTLSSPSAKIPPFRTGKEHLSQPPSASASPFPSSLPNYYHLSIGLSSVFCLLKLNKTFFHGDRMWGGNHLLHCPLTCYRRLQTPLSSPVLCAKHRLPALFPSRMPSEKQTLFKHLLTWSNKRIFCRGSESIRKLTKCQVFLFDLSLTKRKIRQFNPTDQHIIDKSPSSLECAFCIGKTNAFDCTVSQHHTKGKTLIKI